MRETPKRQNKRRSVRDRLTEKLVIMPSGCHEFDGFRDKNGYGKLTVDYTPQGAHRLAYEFAYGPIPKGVWVLHRCDNPPCANPEHLFLGTVQDNVDDMVAKGRAGHGWWGQQTHCVKGHEFSPENTRIAASGQRTCRTCKGWTGLATHCSKGHELTPENEYFRPGDGHRWCLTCWRAKYAPGSHCRRGHELTPENRVPGRPGTCRVCRNETQQRRRRSKKQEV